MVEWNLLAENLSTRFNLELSVSHMSDKKGLLRVEDIEAPNGFGIEIVIGWRSVNAIFRPDSFAAALLRTMSESSPEQRSEFSGLAKAFLKHGIRVLLRLNGSAVDTDLMPSGNLDRFELQCTFLSDRSDDHSVALEAASSCLALVLALLPLESTEAASTEEPLAFSEGNQFYVEVTRYERNPSNRAAAITIHGTKCKVCGFDFEEKYGAIGSGFIEIHHKTPVSRMGENYMVNPAEDLVPLCANCHRMAHKANPPLTLEELIRLLESGR